MEDGTPPSPTELPQQWRRRAKLLRDNGASDQARLLEHLAGELDQAFGAGGDEVLCLVEAAEESGYSADYLGSLIRRGKIPNAGCKNAPRIRRSDPPRKKPSKPGRPPTTTDEITDARALKKMTTRR